MDVAKNNNTLDKYKCKLNILILGLTKYILTLRNPEDKKSQTEEFPGLIHTRNKEFDEYLAGVVDKMVGLVFILI
jgi:hypothetical protein